MTHENDNYNLLAAINDLPDLLKETVNLMETPQEKYMGLYATTVLTGSLMPHIWTNYDGKVNHPALMLSVSFPPAAGKGKLALLPLVLKKINDELRATNNHLMKTYRMDVKEYEKNKKAGNLIPPPEKPRLPLLLNPAKDKKVSAKEMNKEQVIRFVSEAYEYGFKVIEELDEKTLLKSFNWSGGKMNKYQFLNLIQDHQAHHVGQLVVYLRLNEIAPPRYIGW